jgi:glutathione S-transferase
MALIIYGSPYSRTIRTLWTAEELGLSYEHRALSWDDPELKSPAFLRLNPAGTIPTIVDDGHAVAESLAINLYLTKKYGSDGPAPLYPADLYGEAEAWRWSLWAQAHLEPWVQRDTLLAELVATLATVAEPAVERGLALLDHVLGDRAWLAGDHFGVADLNVAAILSPSRVARLKLERFDRVRQWLASCYGRPAARAVRRRFAAVTATTGG